jgi:hypothetical protein
MGRPEVYVTCDVRARERGIDTKPAPPERETGDRLRQFGRQWVLVNGVDLICGQLVELDHDQIDLLHGVDSLLYSLL